MQVETEEFHNPDRAIYMLFFLLTQMPFPSVANEICGKLHI
jgi:hypothetical protein